MTDALRTVAHSGYATPVARAALGLDRTRATQRWSGPLGRGSARHARAATGVRRRFDPDDPAAIAWPPADVYPGMFIDETV